MKLLFNFLIFILTVFCNEYCMAGGMCIRDYDSSTHRYVYFQVDIMPEYPGGIQEYFMGNFKYPPHQEVFQSKIVVDVIVEKDGKLSDLKIHGKKKQEYSEVERETIRLMSKMPKWTAGTCKGRQVPVKITFPLIFEPG